VDRFRDAKSVATRPFGMYCLQMVSGSFAFVPVSLTVSSRLLTDAPEEFKRLATGVHARHTTGAFVQQADTSKKPCFCLSLPHEQPHKPDALSNNLLEKSSGVCAERLETQESAKSLRRAPQSPRRGKVSPSKYSWGNCLLLHTYFLS
jgi:hypothetical protein